MGAVTIALCLTLVLIAIVITVVAVLRRRPGLRRRGDDPRYDGPARRASDCRHEVHEAVTAALHGRPDETNLQDASDVKMTSSSSTKGSK